MRRVLSAMTVTCLLPLALSACSQISPQLSTSKDSQTNVIEDVGYYYFLCEATSRELNDASRLSCEDSQCIYLSLTYQLTNRHVLEKGDSCQILWTPLRDNRSPDAMTMGTYAFRGNAPDELNILRVPDNAMLSGSGDVRVEYPALGTYKFWLTRARQAVSISAIPESPVAGELVTNP